MISIEVLNESNIIALLLLARCLKYIWHASTTRNISCFLRSWNRLLCWNLRSIETSWISFLINNFLNSLWIDWILKLISLCVINTIIQRFKPYSSTCYLLLLIVCSSKIRCIIITLILMRWWWNILIYLLISTLLSNLIL